MITVIYNNSNVTIYRIPINGKQTRIFTLPHQSDPQILQVLIDFFNHTTTTTNQTISSTVASTITETINQCQTQNILLIISSLIIICLFLLFIFLIYIQVHQDYRNKKHYQPTADVLHDGTKTNDHNTYFLDNDRLDDDDDDSDNGKTMVYHLNHREKININNDPSIPEWRTSLPYISEHFL